MTTAIVSPAIKLVIFDLDGVLMESKELHYEALNRVSNLLT
jgi:beta-phosphoglucomutase-like phosphatase (HAD superfamily)